MELPERVTLPISLEDFPEIIDVRSPLEFAEDHLPGAINLPVLSNEERHEVGLLHAENPYAARRLGATLITGNIHRHLSGSLANHPNSFAPLIYCWRGNLRSTSMAVVFRAIGWRARVLDGGYKAWRKFLIHDLEPAMHGLVGGLIVLGGLTGCGKTRLLHELEKKGAQVLDLEGLANHRGSILGREPNAPQPSQKRFESLLWQKLRTFDPGKPVFTEAESNRIGRLQCPPALWKRLGAGRVVLVELPIEERAKLLTEDYDHFIANPTTLKETLDHLRRIRGHEQVDLWHDQIDQGKWKELLRSILEDHYDLSYRRPGSPDSVYSEPESRLPLPSAAPSDLSNAARELIASFPAK